MSDSRQATDYCIRCNKFEKLYVVRGRTSNIYACGRQISFQAGTMLRRSTTPYEKWQMAYRILEQNPSASAKSLERELSVTYKTAWRIKKLIKNDMEQAVILFG